MGLDRRDPILSDNFGALHLIDIAILHLGRRTEWEIFIRPQKARILLML